MKEIEIFAKIRVFENVQEMNEEDRELMSLAHIATDLSHSPYSEFKVGCAIRLTNGEIVKGANQENASYPVCLCAEGVALANAAANFPNVAIDTMAITLRTKTGNINYPVAPCGLCRQSISEYENRHGKKIQLLLQGDSGEIYHINSIRDILPLSFSSKDLI